MKLNLKNNRYWQYQYELYQAKGLTARAREVYSFLYTHCVYYHDNGYCGLSNVNLADIFKSSTDYVERALKELKEKEFIVIKNHGKRTKRTGHSREIYINAKNYIVEDVQDVEASSTESQELKSLKVELEELRKENSRLRFEQAQYAYITEIGRSLIKTGFISQARYQEQAQELNHILLDFESWHGKGRDLTKACFNYWNTHQDSYIKNPVQYILACIDASKNWLNKKDRTVEEYEEEQRKTFERWSTENGQ